MKKIASTSTHLYSPGGCGCAVLMVPFLAMGIAVMTVLASLAFVAFALLAAAIAVSIWLYRTREQRRAAGKKNTGWAVFLVIAYVLSLGYLLLFAYCFGLFDPLVTTTDQMLNMPSGIPC